MGPSIYKSRKSGHPYLKSVVGILSGWDFVRWDFVRWEFVLAPVRVGCNFQGSVVIPKELCAQLGHGFMTDVHIIWWHDQSSYSVYPELVLIISTNDILNC